MELFESYPVLEDELIIIRRLSQEDAPRLGTIARNRRIYRFLPTFLYEQSNPDPVYVIEHMHEDCFLTRQSIILGVYLKKEPDVLEGLAEIYNYDERKQKASIGYRLDERIWGRGIATRVAGLLKDYLLNDIGLRTITAHVMKMNIPSAKVLIGNGFVNKYPDILGDWGFDELTLTDKYVFKRSWLSSAPRPGLAVDVDRFTLFCDSAGGAFDPQIPEGFSRSRPGFRISAEIRDDREVCMDICVPVVKDGRSGCLQIFQWKTSLGDEAGFERSGKAVAFDCPLFCVRFEQTGQIRGNVPEEGVFVFQPDVEFRPPEKPEGQYFSCTAEVEWKKDFSRLKASQSYCVSYVRQNDHTACV